MNKTFTFKKGEVVATVDIKYDIKKDGKRVFTASGRLSTPRRECIGQCLDEIAKYIDDEKFKTIYRLWKMYHLNNMHPECEHQEQLGWRKNAQKIVPIYQFVATADTLKAKEKVKNTVIGFATKGELYLTNEKEQQLLRLQNVIRTHESSLPKNIAKFYHYEEIGNERLGWLTPDEHPNGLLERPCPVCGYKYGTVFLYRPIPLKDEIVLLELFQ